MSKQFTQQEILDFLKNNFIMQVATCHDNKPAVSVLLYAIDDDFNFYFSTHNDSYKAQYLVKNPQISLTVWEHKQMMVQADGKTELVTNHEQSEHIMDLLAEAVDKGKDFWPPVFRIKGGDYAVFKIKLHWLRALDLTTDTVHQTDSPFTEIKL